MESPSLLTLFLTTTPQALTPGTLMMEMGGQGAKKNHHQKMTSSSETSEAEGGAGEREESDR